MLASFLKKAKAATQKWWKWILAGLIAVVVVYVVWKLKRQRDQIAELKVEIDALKDMAKDLEIKAKNAADTKEAEALVAGASALHISAKEMADQLMVLEAEYAKQAKVVEDVKDWQALRRLAKEKPNE